MHFSVIKVDRGGPHTISISASDVETGIRYLFLVNDFHPYFFVHENEVSKINNCSGVHRVDYDGIVPVEGEGTLVTVYFNTTRDANFAKRKFRRIWEADIPYTQRFILDTDCRGIIELPVDGHSQVVTISKDDIKHVRAEHPNPRIHHIDIEVASDRFIKPEEASEPICNITVFDSKTEAFYSWSWHPSATEFQMDKELYSRALKKFVPWHKQWYSDPVAMVCSYADWHARNIPHVLTGWNVIDYDVQYIVNYMKNNGVHLELWTNGDDGYDNLFGCQLVDMLPIYRTQAMRELKSYTLGYVAEKECGIELVKEDGNILHWFQNEPGNLLTYNALDVDATLAIDTKLSIVNFALDYQAFVGVDNTMDISKASVVVDVAHLREARSRSIALPTRLEDNTEGKYTGAVVLTPDPGLHDNVVVIDFSRMYPSIIMGWNLSYETYGKAGIDPGNGYTFAQQPEGISPAVTKRLAQMRAHYDRLIAEAETGREKEALKRKRAPAKTLIVALYGALGFERYRLYRRAVAETVTYVGRELIKYVKDKCESKGYTVVYGDTDSVMVRIGLKPKEEAIQEAQELTDYLNSQLQEYAKLQQIDGSFLTMDLEKLYDRMFIGKAKKRYAGRIVWQDGKMLKGDDVWTEIKGFEQKRSETPTVSAELQETLFKMLFDGATPQQVFEFVDPIARKIVTGETQIKDAVPCPKLNKDMHMYPPGYLAAKAARYSSEHLDKEFRPGDRVYYVYVRSTPPQKPPTNVIGLTPRDHDIPEGFIPDRKLIANRAVTMKVQKIFEAMGWDYMIRSIGSGVTPAHITKTSLGDFM